MNFLPARILGGPEPQSVLAEAVREPEGFIPGETTFYTVVDGVNVASHVFKGWYTAAEGGELWDFSVPVAKENGGALTLYAQWETVNLFDAAAYWYLNHADDTSFTIAAAEEFRVLAWLVNGTLAATGGNGVALRPVDFTGKTVTLAQDITTEMELDTDRDRGAPFRRCF